LPRPDAAERVRKAPREKQREDVAAVASLLRKKLERATTAPPEPAGVGVVRKSFFDRAMQTLAEMIGGRFRKTDARIEALERRLASAMTFRGPHIEGGQYLPNEVVQKASTIWICTEPTQDTPPSPRWRLLVRAAK
jgi:hypothetical protein